VAGIVDQGSHGDPLGAEGRQAEVTAH
jgi:hypothetical protein